MSEAYDFTVASSGHYNFEPRNRFFIVNPVTKRVTMVRAGSTHGTSVEWAGGHVALVARGNSLSKVSAEHQGLNLKFKGCSGTQEGIITQATHKAIYYVQDALTSVDDTPLRMNTVDTPLYSFLEHHDWRSAPRRYERWFGKPDHKRWELVHKTLEKIHDRAPHVSYDCVKQCKEDERAYVLILR